MHASSMENMVKLYNNYLDPVFADGLDSVRVLDVGGARINGSYRDVFGPGVTYMAADLSAGEGVDIVLDDPYRIPVPDGSFDVVLSGQMFEHCEFFWLAFQEMMRVVNDRGVVCLIAPSGGPIHRYPVDCYRFYPDSYAALARYAGCHLEASWLDERGPWYDLVGVFRKQAPDAAPRPGLRVDGPHRRSRRPALAIAAPADPAPSSIAADSPDQEATSGIEDSVATLGRIHAAIRPELYVEIGVGHGRSLALASRPAIGIDPDMQPSGLGPHVALYHETSDEFFERHATEAIGRPIDLAFIDGLHLFEFALRDFMNLERRASRRGLVVIDGVFPNDATQGSRHRTTRTWCGDVWRIVPCLQEARPDLLLLPLDCAPAGMLLVAGLNPEDRTLWDQYNPIVRRHLLQAPDAPPPQAVLDRTGALAPSHPLVVGLLEGLGGCGEPESIRGLVESTRMRCRERTGP
ncbi:hypothetical protein OJF2_49070 [Aquisphaera giovannonii]|uniref:Methyltransferase type 11 domain-containing protein n=1 Tax=Aquisphaera giovannonii TaxID=406548 RepID=A0A5B9W6Q5_9BACT|nr:methyltransferase domain-containing protein [Aquisphaera giovannonii]QEH36346.1 hypothetical protein OJF2_49070 [Aquisphaera giovannonii]